jgi:chemotaxis protein MotB
MMAFFLLMWLLASTTEGDRKGIADFFSSPAKVALPGGVGTGASQSIIPGGGKNLTMDAGQTGRSNEDAFKRKMAAEQMRADTAKQDARKMAALSAKISAMIANTPRLSEFNSQIRLETTPDGLQIQIIDDQKRPMFDTGSAIVKPYMRDILREIGSALSGVDNKISLDGHTDRAPYGSGERGYSNWELSADRANASRRELIAGGMPEDKVGRVMGLSSSVLLEPDNPLSPSNRRISIIVMTREAEERLMGSAGRPLPPPASPPPSPGDAGSKSQ